MNYAWTQGCGSGNAPLVSASPGKEMAEEWRWGAEYTRESGASKEMTEPSILANGKYNIEFSCALALERFPTSRQWFQHNFQAQC